MHKELIRQKINAENDPEKRTLRHLPIQIRGTRSRVGKLAAHLDAQTEFFSRFTNRKKLIASRGVPIEDR